MNETAYENMLIYNANRNLARKAVVWKEEYNMVICFIIWPHK